MLAGRPQSASKPHLKVMCAFSRRFDASYRDAHEKMQAGLIGKPLVFRSQTCDKYDPSPFLVNYSRTSDGNFVDMSVHDIDLCLWFLGHDLRIKSIAAAGITGKIPQLAQHHDFDNGVGIVEFYGGKVAYFYNSKIMAHGQEDTTEVIGTRKTGCERQSAVQLRQCIHSCGCGKRSPATLLWEI